MNPIKDNSHTPTIQQVIDNDMCIACGACIQACPENAIEPRFHNGRMAHEVRITKPEACVNCPMPCDPVCPSINVSLPTPSSEPWGPIQSIWVGHSPQFVADKQSSSGGIIRAIMQHALTQDTSVLCLGKDGDDFKAILNAQASDLKNIPGSIYHSTSFTEALPLIMKSAKPILLVAIPCQLEGIMNYINRHQSDLRDKIKLIVGLICGWMYSHHSLKAFAHFKNIREPVLSATYRGESKVGFLRLRTSTQSMRFSRRNFPSIKEHIDYAASFSHPANRLRCRVCQNHTNVHADISVGDAWLKHHTKNKYSLIITRSLQGQAFIDQMRNQKIIHLSQGRFEDIIESQSRPLVMGSQGRTFSHFLKKVNISAPTYYYQNNSTLSRSLSQQILGELSMRFELHLRHILRLGHYKRFRSQYVLWRWHKILKHFILRIFPWIKK